MLLKMSKRELSRVEVLAQVRSSSSGCIMQSEGLFRRASAQPQTPDVRTCRRHFISLGTA